MSILRTILLLLSFLAINTHTVCNNNPIDSLTKLVELPAHDTIRGQRYLQLAKAWFWENPRNTDSLLRIAATHFVPHNFYYGLSDVHNFRANYHYMGGRPLAACSSLDTAMQFAALAGDSLHMIGIRKNLTILRSEAGDIDGAFAAIEESMEYLLLHQDTSLLAEHFVQRGLLYRQKGYERLALKDFQTAREFHASLNEINRVAEAEQHIGKTLFDKNNFAEALPYYESAAANYLKANQKQYYAEVLTLLGATYLQLELPQKADSSFAAAITLSETLEQPYNIAHAKLLRAEGWVAQKTNLSEAQKDATESLAVYEEIMPIMAGSAHLLLAKIYLLNSASGSALNSIKNSLEIFEENGAAGNLRNAHRLEAKVYTSLSQPEAALLAYQKAQLLSDSLFSIRQTNAIAELHLEYDTELKEREIALKASQIKRLATENENTRLKNRLLGISLIAVLSILGIGFYSYQLRQKSLRAEVRHRERELAAQRLHLLQKNTLLQQVEDQLSHQVINIDQKQRQKLLSTLKTQEALDKDWDTFTTYFKAVHANFTEALEHQFPSLSLTEKRLAYLFRLGTNTAEAAALLHIQPESVRKGKYRLKKKLLPVSGADDRSLEDILRQIA